MEPNNPNNPTQFLPPPEKPVENKKLAAGLCALMLGGLGVHKFILGYNAEGAIILVVNLLLLFLTFVTCGLGIIVTAPLMSAIGIITLIEGIIYLSKTDEEFYETYQKNKKSWF